MSSSRRCMDAIGLPSVHFEVRMVLLFRFLNSVAMSLWLRTAWSPLVYLRFGNRNSTVGWLGAANGLFEILGAAVGGYMADRLHDDRGRHRVLFVSLLIGLVSLAAHVFGLTVLPSSYTALVLAQCLYGVYLGTCLSSTEALVGDCVADGERDRLYSFKLILERSGPILGCAVSLGMFWYSGDSWDDGTLLAVNVVGLILHGASLLILLFAVAASRHGGNDDHPVGGSGNSGLPDAGPGATPLRMIEGERLPSRCCGSDSPCPLFTSTTLPYLIVSGDTLLIVGSGFTTLYFSLFLMEEYKISPMWMSVVSAGCGIATSLIAIVVGHVGPMVGRLWCIFSCKMFGCGLLLFIIISLTSASSVALAPLAVMCVAYAMRFGAMNGSDGATRALLMDIVPASQRARWSAVESLQSASWSGTSVIGGYVADRYGFATAFFLTLCFHTVATVSLVPALWVDDRPSVLFARRSVQRRAKRNAGFSSFGYDEDDSSPSINNVAVSNESKKRIASSVIDEEADNEEDEGCNLIDMSPQTAASSSDGAVNDEDEEDEEDE